MEAPTSRTQVRRHPERGAYDREVVNAILDEALICHLAYVADDGSPRVIPTIHTRVEDTLYLHGSAASRTMRATKTGLDVAVVATIVDGLVLARSAANHSMNYRSVVVYGTAREVTDPSERLVVARSIVEHVIPGRAEHVRMPDETENRETTMLAVPLAEASAKIRTGPPLDDEADLSSPVWAGVLPVSLAAGTP
ncbi:MAG: pyridoxamine 5'-phosphate oxidase family protein, partial [Actinobacteria bacterium]|nr:pyridoxamine 5'-phosphate oxidase family protein [Actinomycetota bacterium]